MNLKFGARHLHKALKHPDNDDTAKVHASCRRDEHVEERRGHDGKAKHPGRKREREEEGRKEGSPDDDIRTSGVSGANLFAANF